MRIKFALVLTLFIVGCTTTNVKKIDPLLQVSHICIQYNPKVIVAEFVPVVRKGFERHGITSETYTGSKPSHCEFHLTYVALKNWDMGTYMHHAELRLYEGVNPVAHAEYHLVNKGGLALNKWDSVESKMNPVIDELLAGYSPEMVNLFRKEVPDPQAQPQDVEDYNSARLRELKVWREEGLITEEEYNIEKQKVLSK